MRISGKYVSVKASLLLIKNNSTIYKVLKKKKKTKVENHMRRRARLGYFRKNRKFIDINKKIIIYL